MAGERRLNLGTDATDARYQIEDAGPDGDLVVRDSDNNREVFRYDGVNDEFELRDTSATAIKTGNRDGTLQVGDGDSIQDTIDDAPAEAVEVRVRPNWDPSVESFPVTVETGDTSPTIRGPGPVGRDPKKHTPSGAFFDLGGVSAHAFDIIGEESDGTTHNWAPNVVLEGFAITGAEGLVTIKDVDSSAFTDLYCYEATGNAYEIRSDSESAIWNTWTRCHALEGTGNGFVSESGAKANSNTFVNCVARDLDGMGLDWVSGVGSGWWGGTIERNGTYNADIQSPSFTMFDVYFEPSGSATADVIFRGSVSDGGRVLACRFNGRSTGTERAVLINPADGVRVDHNTYQNYSGGFFQVSSGADNQLGQHNVARDSTPLLRSDSGTRTRFGNILGGGPLDGVDVGSVSGSRNYDFAINRGGAGINDTLWIWDSANAEWTRCDGDTSITP